MEPSFPPIIGLCGEKGVGKSALAEAIAAATNGLYKVNTFKNNLRVIAHLLTGIPMASMTSAPGLKVNIGNAVSHFSEYSNRCAQVGELLHISSSDVQGAIYSFVIWNADETWRFVHMELRNFMQELVKIFKVSIKNRWLAMTLDRARLTVVDDVKYKVEADEIRRRGGVLVYLCHPRVPIQIPDDRELVYPVKIIFPEEADATIYNLDLGVDNLVQAFMTELPRLQRISKNRLAESLTSVADEKMKE